MKALLLSMLLSLSSQSFAAVGDAVPLPSWKGRAAPNGDVIVKMEQVNSTGTPIPTPSAGGSNVVLNGISGAAATSYYDKLTSSAAAYTNQIAAPSAVSSPAYTVQTYTATSIPLTVPAGINGEVKSIWLTGGDGGAALRYMVTAGSTAPTDLVRRGSYLLTTATTQVSGPWPSANWYLHMIGVGASSVYTGVQFFQ